MPSDGTCGLTLTKLEREHLAIILMGDFALRERIEQTPPNERELTHDDASPEGNAQRCPVLVRRERTKLKRRRT